MCLSLRSNRDGDCSIIKTRTFATASIPCALIVSTTCVAAQLDVKERLPKSCQILTLMLNTEIERMIKLQERAKKEEKVPPTDLQRMATHVRKKGSRCRLAQRNEEGASTGRYPQRSLAHERLRYDRYRSGTQNLRRSAALVPQAMPHPPPDSALAPSRRFQYS